MGSYEFMVRPVRLETTGSGSFYNLGAGKTDTATIEFDGKPDIKLNYSLFYVKNEISLPKQLMSKHSISFDAGDGRIFCDSIPCYPGLPKSRHVLSLVSNWVTCVPKKIPASRFH